MKILPLFGWQSVSGSVKSTYFKDQGHEVIKLALPDNAIEKAGCIA